MLSPTLGMEASSIARNTIHCIDKYAQRVWVAKLTDDLVDSTTLWNTCPEIMPYLIKTHEYVWDYAIDQMNLTAEKYGCKVLKLNEIGDCIECVVFFAGKTDQISQPDTNVPIALLAWEFGLWIKILLRYAFMCFEQHFHVTPKFRLGLNFGSTHLIRVAHTPEIPFTVDTFQVGNETDHTFFQRGKEAEDEAPPNEWLRTVEFMARFAKEAAERRVSNGVFVATPIKNVAFELVAVEQTLVLPGLPDLVGVQNVLRDFIDNHHGIVAHAIVSVNNATSFPGFVGFLKVEMDTAPPTPFSKRCVLWEALSKCVDGDSWVVRYSKIITIISTQDNASSWNFVSTPFGKDPPVDRWRAMMAAFKDLDDLIQAKGEGHVQLKVVLCYDEKIVKLSSPDETAVAAQSRLRLGDDSALFVRYICHAQNRAARIIYSADAMTCGTIATDCGSLKVIPDAYFYNKWCYNTIQLKSLGGRLVLTCPLARLGSEIKEGKGNSFVRVPGRWRFA